VRNAEPGNAVIFDDLGGTPDCGRLSDSPDHASDADVGHDDYTTLAPGEQNGVRCSQRYKFVAHENRRIMETHGRSGWSISGRFSGQRR
jgi:hypothetical protein